MVTSTTGSDTESTTSADTDLQSTPTLTAVDNPVDLINPLLDDCAHYILMMGTGKAPPPQPPPAAGAAAGATAGPLPVMLPQARLPQPTVFDGTTPPFQEWIQETRNFLSINNYEFVRQMDYSLQSDHEVSLHDVTNSTREGGRRQDLLDDNETGQADLRRELELPLDERADDTCTNETIERELANLRRDHIHRQRDYDEWIDRLERGADYLNYVLIHGTKLGTEANNYIRRLQRSTNGFEALRLMRLRFSGGQMLQNYQLLRDILNPKFTESQQHFQYRQWLESLSRYELEARQPLDDNLKIGTLVNGLRGNLQQHLLVSVKPTSTWQNVREIVENYYSSTFVPNPTTGHIAYLAHGSPEEQVNYVKGRRKGKGKGKGGKARKEETTKVKERAKAKESEETTKEKEKDTTKEEKDTTKDGIHGVKEDTAITTKDNERVKEKEERQELLLNATSAKSSDVRQPTAGTRTLPTLQQLLVQALLVRHNTSAWTTLRTTNQLLLCLETNYHSTTNMDSVFQVPTCRLLQHLEQLLQALHPTSLLQDLYYMTSAMSTVMENPTTTTTCLRSTTTDN